MKEEQKIRRERQDEELGREMKGGLYLSSWQTKIEYERERAKLTICMLYRHPRECFIKDEYNRKLTELKQDVI